MTPLEAAGYRDWHRVVGGEIGEVEWCKAARMEIGLEEEGIVCGVHVLFVKAGLVATNMSDSLAERLRR